MESGAVAGSQETWHALEELHCHQQLVRQENSAHGLLGVCSGPGSPLVTRLTTNLNGEILVISYRTALPKSMSSAMGTVSNPRSPTWQMPVATPSFS